MECMLNRRIVQESGGDTSETWVLNERVVMDTNLSVAINFISNKSSFSLFHFANMYLKYDNTTASSTPEIGEPTVAMKVLYRKIIFATAPTGDLLTWLQTNGVKQEKNLAIQPSKSLTITSNGTTTITPAEMYDAMGQVDLTVNVANDITKTTNVNIIADDIETTAGYAKIEIIYQSVNGLWLKEEEKTLGPEDSFTLSNVLVGGYIIFHTTITASYLWRVNNTNNIDVEAFLSSSLSSTYEGNSFILKVTGENASINMIIMN